MPTKAKVEKVETVEKVVKEKKENVKKVKKVKKKKVKKEKVKKEKVKRKPSLYAQYVKLHYQDKDVQELAPKLRFSLIAKKWKKHKEELSKNSK